MNCLMCNIEFEPRRSTAKFCSPNCKLKYNRLSVSNGLSVSSPKELSVSFRFYTVSKANGMGRTKDEKSKVRTAKYWYDVPLGAIPVYEKDWPKMPDYMNGRQYFLWWKNEFKLNDGSQMSSQKGLPEILNPFPVHDKVRLELAGEQSRRWGA